ncbi:hypothetical protein ACHAXH_001436 [Discostella pseudostelligera]
MLVPRRGMAVAIVALLPAPAAAAASWTCSLMSRPLENIPISPEQQQQILQQQQEQQSSLGRGNRNLLRVPLGMDAIVVPGGWRRELTTGNSSNDAAATTSLFNHPTTVTSTTNATYVYHEGRHCGCANNYLSYNGVVDLNADEFYCPTPANQCSVWITRDGDSYDYGVRCFKNMSWAVTTARQLWYYVVFWFVLLALYPIFTRPGHHAIKYILSKCFPRMNGWITEQLLQDEIRTNERIREEFEQAARLRRQQDSEITGYSIKTKRHFKNDASVTKKDESSNVAVNESGEEPTSVQGVVATSIDVTKCSEEGTMCTICLLELEDGDRIADLGCGHFYHAECLGEWVLKKNSCPLCQDQGVATEIRYFETVDDGNNHESESTLHRWRRKTKRMVLNIVTGGHPVSRVDQ